MKTGREVEAAHWTLSYLLVLMFNPMCKAVTVIILISLRFCHVVCHGIVNSIRNPSTVTNPTMKPYCILLPPVA